MEEGSRIHARWELGTAQMHSLTALVEVGRTPFIMHYDLLNGHTKTSSACYEVSISI